jgi:hypothetical protein
MLGSIKSSAMFLVDSLQRMLSLTNLQRNDYHGRKLKDGLRMKTFWLIRVKLEEILKFSFSSDKIA